MIDNSEEEDLQDKEDLIQGAATAAIAASLCAVEHAQWFCDKRCYYNSALNSYNSGKQKPCSTALDGVKESLDLIGMAICELASECKVCQLQLDAHADAAHEQGVKAESPQHRHEAMQHVQQMEV